jgi:enoyl-CoA hydratase/long-chain 3-hydroxyacyl-CoA dehydrogenase
MLSISKNLRVLSSALSSLSQTSRLFSATAGTFFEAPEIKNGVAVLRLNGPEKMNTINQGMQAEIEQLWQEHVANSNDVKAVVFISSKPDNFIAGADINMLRTIQDPEELRQTVMRGHEMFAKVRAKGIPLVSAINGACLGGGLEWAMYCDYRVATTSSKTKLGLPEVMLGIMPGFGGTYHLPQLVGIQSALDMMLTGRQIDAKRAKRMGLVDLVVDPPVLEEVAIRQALELAQKPRRSPPKPKLNLVGRILESTSFTKRILFNQARKMTAKQAKDHYVAPYKILDMVEDSQVNGLTRDQHFRKECDIFVELTRTPQSRALMGLFEGQTQAKKPLPGFENTPKPNDHTVAVLGGGLMGAGIAEVTCTKGKHVLIKDMKKENAYKAVAGIETSLSKKVKRKRMTQHQFNLASANLTPLYEDLGSWERHMRQANIIVEAVFENLEVKQNLIRSIEPVFEGVTDFPIFATNTSALPIRDIAQASTHPDKVVGLHYFSPVPMMPLVEIIPHEGTSQETLNRVLALAVAQGKTPILVKDVPGFYVNRCLAPMMMETQAVVREGHDIQTIDKLMVQHGLPVGPLTLGDEVGLDVAFSMATFMKEKGGLGVRMDGDISLMQQMVEQMNAKGRKTGKGFYLYEDESKSKKSKKSKTKTLNPEV